MAKPSPTHAFSSAGTRFIVRESLGVVSDAKYHIRDGLLRVGWRSHDQTRISMRGASHASRAASTCPSLVAFGLDVARGDGVGLGELLRAAPASSRFGQHAHHDRRGTDADEPDRHEGEVARQGQLARGGDAPFPGQLGALHARVEARLRLEFRDLWDVALIETTSDVSLPYLAKTEGGYLDTVEGQQVAFSPRNAFFVSFKPTILGVSFPANRQDLGAGCGRSSVTRSRRSRSISRMRSRSRMARITWSSRSTSETCSRAAHDSRPAAYTPRASRARRSISTRSPRCSHR